MTVGLLPAAIGISTAPTWAGRVGKRANRRSTKQLQLHQARHDLRHLLSPPEADPRQGRARWGVGSFAALGPRAMLRFLAGADVRFLALATISLAEVVAS